MTGRIIKYSEPVPFHKAMPGSISIPIMKRYDNGIPEEFTPPKRKTQPKVRNARNEPIDDEIGKPDKAKKGSTMIDYDYDNSRGPWHAMIDKQALAIQAQIGCSYAQAFTKAYTDPKNAAIVEQYKYDDLAKAYDAIDGGQRSMANSGADVKKALADATLEAQARSRAEITGETYAKAYTEIYCNPENVALRNGTVSKAAPLNPGSAESEMNDRVADLMRTNPRLTREQAFTRIYVENGPLKQRYDAEVAARPFPPYGNPGDVTYRNPSSGTSGAKPRGWAGG